MSGADSHAGGFSATDSGRRIRPAVQRDPFFGENEGIHALPKTRSGLDRLGIGASGVGVARCAEERRNRGLPSEDPGRVTLDFSRFSTSSTEDFNRVAGEKQRKELVTPARTQRERTEASLAFSSGFPSLAKDAASTCKEKNRNDASINSFQEPPDPRGVTLSRDKSPHRYQGNAVSRLQAQPPGSLFSSSGVYRQLERTVAGMETSSLCMDQARDALDQRAPCFLSSSSLLHSCQAGQGNPNCSLVSSGFSQGSSESQAFRFQGQRSTVSARACTAPDLPSSSLRLETSEVLDRGVESVYQGRPESVRSRLTQDGLQKAPSSVLRQKEAAGALDVEPSETQCSLGNLPPLVLPQTEKAEPKSSFVRESRSGLAKATDCAPSISTRQQPQSRLTEARNDTFGTNRTSLGKHYDCPSLPPTKSVEPAVSKIPSPLSSRRREKLQLHGGMKDGSRTKLVSSSGLSFPSLSTSVGHSSEEQLPTALASLQDSMWLSSDLVSSGSQSLTRATAGTSSSPPLSASSSAPRRGPESLCRTGTLESGQTGGQHAEKTLSEITRGRLRLGEGNRGSGGLPWERRCGPRAGERNNAAGEAEAEDFFPTSERDAREALTSSRVDSPRRSCSNRSSSATAALAAPSSLSEPQRVSFSPRSSTLSSSRATVLSTSQVTSLYPASSSATGSRSMLSSSSSTRPAQPHCSSSRAGGSDRERSFISELHELEQDVQHLRAMYAASCSSAKAMPREGKGQEFHTSSTSRNCSIPHRGRLECSGADLKDTPRDRVLKGQLSSSSPLLKARESRGPWIPPRTDEVCSLTEGRVPDELPSILSVVGRKEEPEDCGDLSAAAAGMGGSTLPRPEERGGVAQGYLPRLRFRDKLYSTRPRTREASESPQDVQGGRALRDTSMRKRGRGGEMKASSSLGRGHTRAASATEEGQTGEPGKDVLPRHMDQFAPASKQCHPPLAGGLLTSCRDVRSPPFDSPIPSGLQEDRLLSEPLSPVVKTSFRKKLPLHSKAAPSGSLRSAGGCSVSSSSSATVSEERPFSFLPLGNSTSFGPSGLLKSSQKSTPSRESSSVCGLSAPDSSVFEELGQQLGSGERESEARRVSERTASRRLSRSLSPQLPCYPHLRHSLSAATGQSPERLRPSGDASPPPSASGQGPTAPAASLSTSQLSGRSSTPCPHPLLPLSSSSILSRKCPVVSAAALENVALPSTLQPVSGQREEGALPREAGQRHGEQVRRGANMSSSRSLFDQPTSRVPTGCRRDADACPSNRSEEQSRSGSALEHDGGSPSLEKRVSRTEKKSGSSVGRPRPVAGPALSEENARAASVATLRSAGNQEDRSQWGPGGHERRGSSISSKETSLHEVFGNVSSTFEPPLGLSGFPLLRTVERMLPVGNGGAGSLVDMPANGSAVLAAEKNRGRSWTNTIAPIEGKEMRNKRCSSSSRAEGGQYHDVFSSSLCIPRRRKAETGGQDNTQTVLRASSVGAECRLTELSPSTSSTFPAATPQEKEKDVPCDSHWRDATNADRTPTEEFSRTETGLAHSGVQSSFPRQPGEREDQPRIRGSQGRIAGHLQPFRNSPPPQDREESSVPEHNGTRGTPGDECSFGAALPLSSGSLRAEGDAQDRRGSTADRDKELCFETQQISEATGRSSLSAHSMASASGTIGTRHRSLSMAGEGGLPDKKEPSSWRQESRRRGINSDGIASRRIADASGSLRSCVSSDVPFSTEEIARKESNRVSPHPPTSVFARASTPVSPDFPSSPLHESIPASCTSTKPDRFQNKEKALVSSPSFGSPPCPRLENPLTPPVPSRRPSSSRSTAFSSSTSASSTPYPASPALRLRYARMQTPQLSEPPSRGTPQLSSNRSDRCCSSAASLAALPPLPPSRMEPATNLDSSASAAVSPPGRLVGPRKSEEVLPSAGSLAGPKTVVACHTGAPVEHEEETEVQEEPSEFSESEDEAEEGVVFSALSGLSRLLSGSVSYVLRPLRTMRRFQRAESRCEDLTENVEEAAPGTLSGPRASSVPPPCSLDLGATSPAGLGYKDVPSQTASALSPTARSPSVGRSSQPKSCPQEAMQGEAEAEPPRPQRMQERKDEKDTRQGEESDKRGESRPRQLARDFEALLSDLQSRLPPKPSTPPSAILAVLTDLAACRLRIQSEPSSDQTAAGRLDGHGSFHSVSAAAEGEPGDAKHKNSSFPFDESSRVLCRKDVVVLGLLNAFFARCYLLSDEDSDSGEIGPRDKSSGTVGGYVSARLQWSEADGLRVLLVKERKFVPHHGRAVLFREKSGEGCPVDCKERTKSSDKSPSVLSTRDCGLLAWAVASLQGPHANSKPPIQVDREKDLSCNTANSRSSQHGELADNWTGDRQKETMKTHDEAEGNTETRVCSRRNEDVFDEDGCSCVHIDFSLLLRVLVEQLQRKPRASPVDISRLIFSCFSVMTPDMPSFCSSPEAQLDEGIFGCPLLSGAECLDLVPPIPSLASWGRSLFSSGVCPRDHASSPGSVPLLMTKEDELMPFPKDDCDTTPDAALALLLSLASRTSSSAAARAALLPIVRELARETASMLKSCACPLTATAAWLLSSRTAGITLDASTLSLFEFPLVIARGRSKAGGGGEGNIPEEILEGEDNMEDEKKDVWAATGSNESSQIDGQAEADTFFDSAREGDQTRREATRGDSESRDFAREGLGISNTSFVSVEDDSNTQGAGLPPMAHSLQETAVEGKLREQEARLLVEIQHVLDVLHESRSDIGGADLKKSVARAQLMRKCIALEDRRNAILARLQATSRARRRKFKPTTDPITKPQASPDQARRVPSLQLPQPGACQREKTGEENAVKHAGSQLQGPLRGNEGEDKTEKRRLGEHPVAQLVDLLWGLTTCGVPARPILTAVARGGLAAQIEAHVSFDDVCCLACCFAVQAEFHRLDSQGDAGVKTASFPGVWGRDGLCCDYERQNRSPRSGAPTERGTSSVSSVHGSFHGKLSVSADVGLGTAVKHPNARGNAAEAEHRSPAGPPPSFFERDLASRLQFYSVLSAPRRNASPLIALSVRGDATTDRRQSFSDDGRKESCRDGSPKRLAVVRAPLHKDLAGCGTESGGVSAVPSLGEGWFADVWSCPSPVPAEGLFEETARQTVQELALLALKKSQLEGFTSLRPELDQAGQQGPRGRALVCLSFALRRLGLAHILELTSADTSSQEARLAHRGVPESAAVAPNICEREEAEVPVSEDDIPIRDVGGRREVDSRDRSWGCGALQNDALVSSRCSYSQFASPTYRAEACNGVSPRGAITDCTLSSARMGSSSCSLPYTERGVGSLQPTEDPWKHDDQAPLVGGADKENTVAESPQSAQQLEGCLRCDEEKHAFGRGGNGQGRGKAEDPLGTCDRPLEIGDLEEDCAFLVAADGPCSLRGPVRSSDACASPPSIADFWRIRERPSHDERGGVRASSQRRRCNAPVSSNRKGIRGLPPDGHGIQTRAEKKSGAQGSVSREDREGDRGRLEDTIARPQAGPVKRKLGWAAGGEAASAVADCWFEPFCSSDEANDCGEASPQYESQGSSLGESNEGKVCQAMGESSSDTTSVCESEVVKDLRPQGGVLRMAVHLALRGGVSVVYLLVGYFLVLLTTAGWWFSRGIDA